jgi:hypothetical protein
VIKKLRRYNQLQHTGKIDVQCELAQQGITNMLALPKDQQKKTARNTEMSLYTKHV